MRSLKNISEISVAVLYQAQPPPIKSGIKKPFKPGGYSDSGADIASCLREQGVRVVTPAQVPSERQDLDWVFPDTAPGIKTAIEKGANVLWLNTVLFDGHPVMRTIDNGFYVVGQDPIAVDKFDDKLVTNGLLKANGVKVTDSVIVNVKLPTPIEIPFRYPVVVKPIRGRGSQGVRVVENKSDFQEYVTSFVEHDTYGDSFMVEEFLPGEEITITVLPPGKYVIHEKEHHLPHHWCLPPVKRINHQNGVAPYNGTVAIIDNSIVLSDDEMRDVNVKAVMKQCEAAGALVHAKAPIRIDCRADASGQFVLFDLNMKPNMTGPSRPHRLDQDSLSSLAARKIGWGFSELIMNILNQRWSTVDR